MYINTSAPSQSNTFAALGRYTNNDHIASPSHHRTYLNKVQGGASLVELMVGLAIGLMVMNAALTSLLSNTSLATQTNSLMQLHQEATQAMQMIGRQVMRANNRVLLAPASGQASYSFSNPDPPTLAGAVSFVHGSEAPQATESYTNINNVTVDPARPDQALGTTPDVLTVMYQVQSTGNQSPDCLGNTNAIQNGGPATHTIATNTFYVAVSGGQLSLMCLGSANTGPQPLAVGVEDFQVMYLVNTAAPGASPAFRLLGADQIGVQAAWNQVIAVHVCLQMSSAAATSAPLPNGITSQRTQCNANALPNDGRSRVTLRQAFFLRNPA